MCHYELTYSYLDATNTLVSRTAFTNDLTFTLYSPMDGVNYNFCLVACNECGKSASSQCLDVSRNTCDAPEAPTCITSKIAECGIRIDWFKGNDGGCPVTKYDIEINSGSGVDRFEKYTAGGCGTIQPVQTCEISMRELKLTPFYLRTGDAI